jgi:DNA replication initiation complex subunit (GINS family)
MAEHEDITYKTLRKLQQAEQTSGTFTKIDVDFYDRLSSYMRDLERSVEQEKNPLKLKLFTDEMVNTKKIANSIYELREKKIVQAALATARGATPDLKNLLNIEQKLYTALVEQITASRKMIFEQQTRPSQPPMMQQTSPEKPPVVANNNPIVRVVEDTPEFIGTDEKTYLLRKDDVLTLPQEMTAPLLKKGVVKQVK